MCGIFAYLNFLSPRTRDEIIKILLNGLKRLEYRGYDSAGIAVDGGDVPCTNGHKAVTILLKRQGKVAALEQEIEAARETLNFKLTFDTHVGIAHTRWATHGEPNWVNTHPQRSDANCEFVAIHNGIITNYKDIKAYLVKHGFEFESETDTETIPKLMKHLYDTHHLQHPSNGTKHSITFRELVERTIQQLEGAFALAFKSSHYPGEIVVARRGSPLVIGVKSKTKLATDRFPVLYSKDRTSFCTSSSELEECDTSTLAPVGSGNELEYFFASDASAIIEHTNQVIYLEDNDVAAVGPTGHLTIHRIRNSMDNPLSPTSREVITVKMEIQEIKRQIQYIHAEGDL